MPELAMITANANFSYYTEVQASPEATSNYPALSHVSGGAVLLEGDGTGSILEIPALASFSGLNGLNSFAALQASNGGTVLDTSLATLNEVNLAFDPTATLDTSQITSFTNGKFSMSGGTR